MREIKFRAWDPINYYFVTCDFNTRIKVIVGDLYEKGLVQQFTGLHDKNGKEIYEGDILRDDNHEMTSRDVVFDDGGFYGKWRYTDAGQRRKDHFAGGYLRQDACDGYEIIGNIYENPELLK